MTKSEKQKREQRQLNVKVRLVEMDTVVFMTIIKFPKKRLISISQLKEDTRRALNHVFPEAEIVI